MNISYKIIDIRKKNNLTQEQLAEKLNVSRQTVSNWENGKFYPDIDTLVKISNTFNISLDVLLKEDTIMIKSMDKKLKMNKKLIYSIIGIIILIVIAIPVAYGYHTNDKETTKINTEKEIKEEEREIAESEFTYYPIPDDYTIFSLEINRINGETNESLNSYKNKEIILYIDEDDIPKEKNIPLYGIVVDRKIVGNRNKDLLFIALKDKDYQLANKSDRLGYNFRIELK